MFDTHTQHAWTSVAYTYELDCSVLLCNTKQIYNLSRAST